MTAAMERYEAETRVGDGITDQDIQNVDLKEERLQSRKRMDKTYSTMMGTYAEQQKLLANKPTWVPTKTKHAKEPDELTVTHVNQTHGLIRAEGVDAGAAEQQTSTEWLRNHSVEHSKLTLKDLVNKGKICRPLQNKDSGKVQQHIQFEAVDINEFEYKLNLIISTYTKRIKWILQGSRKIFGLLKGSKMAVLVDCSDANLGFGRLTSFQESLLHLLDEQLAEKRSLYLAAFGTDIKPLWSSPMDVNSRVLDEAKEWVGGLRQLGGCNLLRALKVVCRVEKIDTIVVVLGSVPDQEADVICDYIDQITVGQETPIYTAAYDCNNHQTNITLRKLAENSKGNYHCYASTCEEQIYAGTDISLLMQEIKEAQDVINKIKQMRDGLLGTALVTVHNDITTEISKLPQSRFLPRPPGLDVPLNVDMPGFNPSSSEEWLAKHGMKAKNLDLYQVLAPNAYSYREEFIPVIKKTVQSQVHEKAMAQFQWHDGSVKNIHVDMTQLFEYQKQLGASVKIYEKRIDWLSSASRKIFGTVTENNVVLLVDLSVSNANYLVHIQHSLRLLLEQQMSNKEYFNIITYGATIKSWQPTLVKPTPENLQKCWRWILDLQCEGSRNLLGSLRCALENDEQAKHNVEVEGVYLFTSGVPDQPAEVCGAFLEEASAGKSLRLHAILFNVDDYDAQGAIPSRYANITKTAEILRYLAHCTGGRFHWFRETGIIESDDIAALSLEIDKALNFSKKCSMLVDSVKKKYNLDYEALKQMRMLPAPERPTLPPGTAPRSLPAPKDTVLTQTRKLLLEQKEEEEDAVPKAMGLAWRPSSAKRKSDKIVATYQPLKDVRPLSAKDPMQSVKKNSKKPQQAFFYTDNKNDVGAVYKKYPGAKSVRKGFKLTTISEKEDQLTTKEWLRMYSLSKLKLDLNKLVSGPDCRHVSKPVKALHKTVEAKTCSVFPTINVAGTLKHLQLLPHELAEYEVQVEDVLRRYLKRLQWLLGGSRRVFGTVVERNCVFLLDTSGSMGADMEDLKKELASLIWEQLHKHAVEFNLIRFSKSCESWKPALVEPTDDNCHDAVKWVSGLVADGNTCTLDALQMAFRDPDVEAIYLLTDGKPDTSTSRVLREVSEMNENRGIVINTISFNCDDSTANSFVKALAMENKGRYHKCHGNFDALLFAHKLLTEGFHDHEHPALPAFEGDDLKRLGNEISAARRFLSQSRSYRAMYESLKNAANTDTDTSHGGLTVGGGRRGRPQSAKQ